MTALAMPQHFHDVVQQQHLFPQHADWLALARLVSAAVFEY